MEKNVKLGGFFVKNIRGRFLKDYSVKSYKKCSEHEKEEIKWLGWYLLSITSFLTT